jgi:hypothetical protein
VPISLLNFVKFPCTVVAFQPVAQPFLTCVYNFYNVSRTFPNKLYSPCVICIHVSQIWLSSYIYHDLRSCQLCDADVNQILESGLVRALHCCSKSCRPSSAKVLKHSLIFVITYSCYTNWI